MFIYYRDPETSAEKLAGLQDEFGGPGAAKEMMEVYGIKDSPTNSTQTNLEQLQKAAKALEAEAEEADSESLIGLATHVRDQLEGLFLNIDESDPNVKALTASLFKVLRTMNFRLTAAEQTLPEKKQA